MDLDDIYENYVLEDHTINDNISDVKIAFDLLRSKLNKLALMYIQKDQSEFVRLVDNINNVVGDGLEQYEQMVIKYSPGNYKGLK